MDTKTEKISKNTFINDLRAEFEVKNVKERNYRKENFFRNKNSYEQFNELIMLQELKFVQNQNRYCNMKDL